MYVSCREVIEKQLYDVIGKAHTYMYVSCREVIEKQLYDVIGKAHYIHVRILKRGYREAAI